MAHASHNSNGQYETLALIVYWPLSLDMTLHPNLLGYAPRNHIATHFNN